MAQVTPADGVAGESTGAGHAHNPGAEAAPVASSAVAQAAVPGEAAPHLPPRGAAGKMSPPPCNTASREAEIPGAGSLNPAAGGRTSERERAPARGRGGTPPGGVLSADDALPGGSSGAEWRQKVKAATSALHAAQRRKATRYTRVADRTAGSQFRPGMAVRKPPETPGGAA